MADKSVGELIDAKSVTPTDLFVLEQNGTAKKLTGHVLENWLVSFADGHGGIQSIAKLSTSGLVDTYRITLADTTTFDFIVTNGKSITNIAKTGTSGLVDTYKISYNDGSSQTYTVTNGAKGDKGDNAYVWIKYASQEPTESSHSIGDIPDNWIGIYSGNASTAPTDWMQYKWYKIKGEKGDTGIPATLVNKSVTYQVSDSGTIIPSGAWSESVPVVAQGKFLWTKTETQFNTGEPIISYSVARMGMDGSGSVSSVAGVSPDETGNVSLTASDVGALAVSGGDVTGEIRMNGQPISGLNEPTEGTQAAPKSYVDKRVPLDGSQAMTGNLAMGGNKITNLSDPEDAADAATKGYADTKASLPKTASGTVIALSDASDGPLQGLRIYGRTTQDGTPTPDNPVELVSVGYGGSVGVTVAGKNLLDMSTATYATASGNINGDALTIVQSANFGTCTLPVVGKPNTDYILSFMITAKEKDYKVVWSCTNDVNINANVATDDLNTVISKSVTTGADGKIFIKLRPTAESGVTGSATFSKLQVEEGTTVTAYEPCTAQTLPISTPNGLPGIPVTSGGNYTDADGKQWICDEVDFARGVYVQRIWRLVYDGSEYFGVSQQIKKSFTIPIPKSSVSNMWRSSKQICSHFPIGAPGYYDSDCFSINNDHVIGFQYSGATTVEEFKAYLAEQMDAGTPVTVYYPISDPVETPIPVDELAAYAALHTNKPNTTIYNDAGAHMDVGYYTPNATMRQEDIKEYVDAKHFLATVSLPAASWTGDAAPYTQTVPVSGILATDFPHVTPVYSSTLATALAQKEAWSMVNQGVPGAGEITFTCFEDKPTVEIPIQIEVMR